MNAPHIIKQDDLWSCYACSVAMATGTTREDVLEFLQVNPDGDREDQGIWPDEIYPYLFAHGLTIGAFFADPDPDNLVYPKNYPALLNVKSMRREGKSHSVYWDGCQVLDPNPEIKEILPLESYELLAWEPLIRWHVNQDKFYINTDAAKNLVKYRNKK